jgi:hypothetical protein
MNKKTASNIATIGFVVSGLLFTSSFFVVDNAKAVKRRWIALGFLVGGVAMQNYSNTGNLIKAK